MKGNRSGIQAFPASSPMEMVQMLGSDALERDIIAKHMFPLTILPPLCRESWIVCIADTVCAVREWILGRNSPWSDHGLIEAVLWTGQF